MLQFVILCMLISPLFSMPIFCIGLYQSRRKMNKGYAVPFALLFGTIGYNMVFKYDVDLTRYYKIIDRLKDQELFYILSTDQEKLYTKDFLFYLVSKSSNNNILAFIVGFCCYLIIFYIFFDSVSRYKSTTKVNYNIHIFLIGLVMIAIISPLNLISNVRCVFSYILISFAVYRDWVQKKRNIFTLFLYVIPIGLHISAIIVLVIRICVPFLSKFSKLFVMVALLLPTIIELLYKITSQVNVWYLFKSVVAKAHYYLNWTEGGWADEVSKSVYNLVGRVYGIFFLLIIIIFYFVCKKNKFININEQICDYLYIIAIVALGCLNIKTGAFWRFEAIVVFFCPIILMPIAMNGEKKHKYILYLLYLSAFIMLILNTIHFTRNIVMKEFILGCIDTSILEIIWEVVKGLAAIMGE